MSLRCGCDPPDKFCPVANRLFEALNIAEDEQQELLTKTTAHPKDQSLRYRWQLSCDSVRTCSRLYRRHLEGGDEPPEVPPRLLRAVRDGQDVA